jgi:hypothetical protein
MAAKVVNPTLRPHFTPQKRYFTELEQNNDETLQLFNVQVFP